MYDDLSKDVLQRIEAYRRQLLDAGMKEPVIKTDSRHWLFFKQATPSTAFIVDLCGDSGFLEITYGYASTAFTHMNGNADALVSLGISADEITLREKVVICTDEDEQIAQQLVRQMYEEHLHTEKDSLLACAKEKRKAFIAQISGVLKPLGFKKTGNTWKRALEEGFYLILNLQKSDYADSYYFNVYIGKNPLDYFMQCYQSRLEPTQMSPLDWQALTDEELAFFLERHILSAVKTIIETPFETLGKSPVLWESCLCNRKKCPTCWVKKNLWETKKN